MGFFKKVFGERPAKPEARDEDADKDEDDDEDDDEDQEDEEEDEDEQEDSASEWDQEAEDRAALAANPGALDPVEGVSLELHAEVGAHQSALVSQDVVDELLARHGFDLATYLRAASVWTGRMQKVPPVARRYGQLLMGYSSQQATPFAAVRQAVANNTENGGRIEPFDRFCEMAGALAFYESTPANPEVMLRKHFGLNMYDYLRSRAEWTEQMKRDPAMAQTFEQRRNQFKLDFAKKGVPSSDVEF